MSYELAMGTEEEREPVPGAMFEMDEPDPEAVERERQESIAQREAELQQERETFWSSGTWRQGPAFSRWMHRTLDDSAWGHSMVGRIANRPLKTWLASGHCALFVPTTQECANEVPPSRVIALVSFLLPLATGYYAYRKTDGCWGWTAVGATAGLMSYYPLMIVAMMITPGSFRY